MAFSQPPPPDYTPQRDRTVSRVIILIIILVLIMVAVAAYVIYRRRVLTKCQFDVDCSGTTSRCNREFGICQECLSSSDCPTGLVCSTAFTCV